MQLGKLAGCLPGSQQGSLGIFPWPSEGARLGAGAKRTDKIKPENENSKLQAQTKIHTPTTPRPGRAQFVYLLEPEALGKLSTELAEQANA